MTGQVDFYVLGSSAPQERWRFVCRLTEKAYLRGMRVAILGQSAEDVRILDDLLWTFSDHSFVPHKVCTGQPDTDGATPVRLMNALAAGDAVAADVLVNLSQAVPPEPASYSRIVEILDADPDRRRLGRERFKAYRDLQLTLNTHQIDAAAET
jgi:DNA polymerase III subunit chi